MGAPGPDGDEWSPDSGRSLDRLGHMRIMAPLRDMIEAEDGSKAAIAGERARGPQPCAPEAEAAARSDLRTVEELGEVSSPATSQPRRSHEGANPAQAIPA